MGVKTKSSQKQAKFTYPVRGSPHVQLAIHSTIMVKHPYTLKIVFLFNASLS